MNLISCPVCQGKNSKCLICQGCGQVLDIHGYLFSWQTKLSRRYIYNFRLWHLIRKIIDMVIYVLGILGLLITIWVIYNYFTLHNDFYKFFISHSWGAAIFWLTILIGLYVFYKFSSWRPALKKINYAQLQKPAAAGKQKVNDLQKYFSLDAQQVIHTAYLSAANQQQLVEPIHLLQALFKDKKIKQAFRRLSIDLTKLNQKLTNYTQSKITKSNKTFLSNDLIQILDLALGQSLITHKNYVFPQDILIILASLENRAQQILFDLEINHQKISNTFEWLDLQQRIGQYWSSLRSRASRKPKGPVNRAYTAIATPWLDAFSEDLTQAARAGVVEPSIGSEKVVENIFKSLASGKSGVLLIGESGTGKTTAINYLAELMASEDMPLFFQDKRLVKISVPAIIAGASQTGEIEKRLFALLNEVAVSGNIILFIDRIEDLVGLGTETSESLDLASILAQELEKGYFVLLATTQPQAQRKYLAKSTLNQIMAQVKVDEMDINNSIRALGVKSLILEKRYKVFFAYQAIESAATLSQKFIQGECLPGKAVEVLERAAQQVASRSKSKIVLTKHVSNIVSEMTKIPASKVSADESKKLLNLEKYIHQQVVDQDEAVALVAQALRRARAKLTSGTRPIANFLFLGPTGVGKTQVARTLAEVYFGGQKNMIRLDMSEYSGADALAKLIGQAGTTGSGYLTQQIKEKPFSLILLDEFEKARPQVHNAFLQVMEDGRLTDNQSLTYDFTNTIIIATSNAASQFILKQVKRQVDWQNVKQAVIEDQLMKSLQPELVNRFDAVVVFKPLGMTEVQQITQLMLDKLSNNIQEKGVNFSYTPQAIKELAQAGFDPKFGARPLRRLIQDKVENKLAELLLSKKVMRRDTIVLKSMENIQIKKAERL